MDILTPEITQLLFEAVFGLVMLLLSAVLSYVLRYLRTRVSADTFAFLQKAAMVAVQAAEQLGMNKQVYDKYSTAETMVLHELEQRGIKMTPDQVRTAIEAAVMEAFNSVKVQEEAAMAAKPPALENAQPAGFQPPVV